MFYIGTSLKKERLGATNYNKDGDLMKIINYNNSHDITIEFQDEYKETIKTQWHYFCNGNLINPHKFKSRVGETNVSNQGYLMKCINYIDSHNIIVEFQDKYKAKVNTTYYCFINGNVDNPYNNINKIGEEKLNNQGCLMKIVEYNRYSDIIVEFQDDYKYRKHTEYKCFQSGEIKNPYFPSVHNVGIVGAKYPVKANGKITKEYNTWNNMIKRCFNENVHKKRPTYIECEVCDEWLHFENFYEWLHSQPNFEQWLKLKKSALDKDILIKGNKLYSPETCCLVPQNINNLLLKCDSTRGNNPIGLYYNEEINSYMVNCCENGHGNYKGSYETLENAFMKYKNEKERVIKEVAIKEYNNGNITKKCYEALLKYEVEITD